MTFSIAGAWATIVANFSIDNVDPVEVPNPIGAFSVSHHNIVERNIIDGISQLSAQLDSNEVTQDDLKNVYTYIQSLVMGTNLPMVNYIPSGGSGTQYYAPPPPYNGSLTPFAGDVTLTVTCPTNQLFIVIVNTITGEENKTPIPETGIITIPALFTSCGRTHSVGVKYNIILTSFADPAPPIAPALYGIGGESKKYYLSYTFL